MQDPSCGVGTAGSSDLNPCHCITIYQRACLTTLPICLSVLRCVDM